MTISLPQKGREEPPAEPPSDWQLVKGFFRRIYARFGRFIIIAANVVLVVAAILIYDALKPPPQRLTQRDIDAAVGRTLQALAVKPSDASIAYQTIYPSLVDIFVNTEGKGGRGALGTGVVITDTGIILTCLHVVKDAVRVRVIFADDGTESDAQVVMRQPENDLAVLRANTIPDDLKPATLVASSSLSQGDEVIAVGNPFGLLNSASAGVVSGKGRSFTSKETGATLKDLIQFDAAVNPGNSGGPLVNRNGEVVGIVTALLNPTAQEVFIGIGFAIPIETAAGMMGGLPY
ncbi:MAG: S1C family serine protease [Spirochaetia bacterium]